MGGGDAQEDQVGVEIMRFYNLLPTLVMALSFCAVPPLVIAGKWGSALYWLAAGLLNAAVIFGIARFG